MYTRVLGVSCMYACVQTLASLVYMSVCVFRVACRMTINIELIPISQDTGLFQCSLLIVGSFKILLDCGWTESLDPNLLADVPPVDAVLITHSDLAHCGALPWLVRTRFPAHCRVFATEPVRRLGELTLASLHEDVDKSKNVTVGDWTMTIEDIVGVFDKVEPLQFNQPVLLQQVPEIVITAQPAGRLLGGAYWIISVGTQRIVYTVDYSLASGLHVPGLSLLPAKRGNVLITSSQDSDGSSDVVQFVAAVKATLRGDGSVLVPVDPAARVLELLLSLEAAWNADASLSVYPIVFLSPLGDVVLDQAKTRMEWMNESVLTEFEASANFTSNPFLLNHVTLVASMDEFNDLFPYRKPKVIISTSSSLDFGDSREIFVRYANDPVNLVAFTQIVSPGSLAGRVLAGGPGEYVERQYMKSSFPDEQLREIYRDKLQKEATEDELRRRRAMEKKRAAPSSAAAVPVDLIRAINTEDLFDGTKFFRPSLFAAQTVATSAVLRQIGQISDYGEALTTAEKDTWRAHAETTEIDANEELTDQRVKSSKEENIKGDLDEVKGELGIAAVGGEFDWRRDLTVRFGEPKRVEVREGRIVKVGCRIKAFLGMEGGANSVHRREFIACTKPDNVIMLPTRADLQLVRNLVIGQGGNFYSTQDDSTLLQLTEEKKWVAIDPSASIEWVALGSSQIRVARIDNHTVCPVDSDDAIQVPSGDRVSFALAGNRKHARDPITIASEPFRLGKFARLVNAEFVNTGHGRALLVENKVLVSNKHQEIEVAGTPSETFYRVRDALYSNMTCL